MLRRLPALLSTLLALGLTVWGAWLVATPDYDGGRRPVGGLILVGAVPLLLVSARTLRRRPR
jgi:hypothetical protein